MTITPSLPNHTNASTIRSHFVLTLAAELAATADRSIRMAEVRLGDHGGGGFALRLSSNSTMEGIREVVAGKSDFGIANPSAALTLAHRGRPPFQAPQPVRTIAVIPSQDQYVFAVAGKLGLARFEDIATKRVPLQVSVRGVRDHCLHYLLEDIAAAAGFSTTDLKAWGGELRGEGARPPDAERLAGVTEGRVNAIFDEGAHNWVEPAIDAGMTILPLAEDTVRKLEGFGYRRAWLRKAEFPKLPADVLTIDFSGWPIFVHADLPDLRVTQLCAALDARKDELPWQTQGPLPLHEMCRNTDAAPLDVPLHPAAERFWRARGYL
jgi:TRAP-type uncharacterized transport system substrate-binding protein